MKSIRILAILLSIGLLAVGCSQEPEMTAPDTQTQLNYDKNGTETLGPPTIDIATGSCFAQGGVGMVAPSDGIINIDVPMGATITQVLVYWAGGTTGAPGDDMVKIDGNDVTGELIGGPTNFFSNYWFSAYRADITAMGLVANGPNVLTVTDFNFDFSGGTLDENNGIGIMAIYDDGTEAEISVLDGLDMAYFDFEPTLDATVPQTFTFGAEPVDRMGRMVIFAGSVGLGRPNKIKLTTSAGDDIRDDLLGSDDGLLWDTLCLTDILIPAGDTPDGYPHPGRRHYGDGRVDLNPYRTRSGRGSRGIDGLGRRGILHSRDAASTGAGLHRRLRVVRREHGRDPGS